MNGSLVNQLIEQKYLKSPRIIRAFKKIKRADFVHLELREKEGDNFIAEYNAPLSIGYGQTISQPLTVAFMLELLEPKKGDKILDIGSGSGWQTTMLCEIAGEKGFVFAIERIGELKNFGEENVRKYGFKNVEFIARDGSLGLAQEAPFNRIIAAAAAEKVPEIWKEQLKINGRLVTPINGGIWLFVKKDKNQFEEKEYPGFSFVPLITKNE